MSTDALSGLRIVDLASDDAGSYCARLFGDFGADVVKVEDAAASDAGAQPDARSLYLNQNKRSVALDLSSEQGQSLARRLAISADIIVDSGVSGAGLARLGLSFSDVQRENPKAVVVSITHFGQSGPYAERPACHLTVAALSGWLKVRPGDPKREPIDVGFPLLDFVSASLGAIGAVAAWRGVRSGASGRFVDVSQQEVAVRMYLYPTIAARLGLLTKRQRPFPMYVLTSNGYAAVNALNAVQYRDACLYMELDDEAEEMNPSRIDQSAVAEMQKKMDAWAADKIREEIFEVGQALRIPAGIPYDLLEVVAEPNFHERGFFRQLKVDERTVQAPVGPIARAVRADWKDAPRRGADTTAVLRNWLDADDQINSSEGRE